MPLIIHCQLPIFTQNYSSIAFNQHQLRINYQLINSPHSPLLSLTYLPSLPLSSNTLFLPLFYFFLFFFSLFSKSFFYSFIQFFLFSFSLFSFFLFFLVFFFLFHFFYLSFSFITCFHYFLFSFLLFFLFSFWRKILVFVRDLRFLT
jgi:hypothetical protein